jgi:hypothetical protein
MHPAITTMLVCIVQGGLIAPDHKFHRATQALVDITMLLEQLAKDLWGTEVQSMLHFLSAQGYKQQLDLLEQELRNCLFQLSNILSTSQFTSQVGAAVAAVTRPRTGPPHDVHNALHAVWSGACAWNAVQRSSGCCVLPTWIRATWNATDRPLGMAGASSGNLKAAPALAAHQGLHALRTHHCHGASRPCPGPSHHGQSSRRQLISTNRHLPCHTRVQCMQGSQKPRPVTLRSDTGCSAAADVHTCTHCVLGSSNEVLNLPSLASAFVSTDFCKLSVTGKEIVAGDSKAWLQQRCPNNSTNTAVP